MLGWTKVLAITIAVAAGIIFVYFPRQNVPYLGPLPDDGTCEGLIIKGTKARPYPGNGVNTRGIPWINYEKTTGHCPSFLTSKSYIKIIADFSMGATIGASVIFSAAKIIVRKKA